MKESGINFFISQLGLAFDTGSFDIFYTFEDGAGVQINSISLGNNAFSGQINSIDEFWTSPGSGFFSGNSISVFNASGLQSSTFTHIFSIEKVNRNGGILFSNIGSSSGYRIGLTDSNRLFLETCDGYSVSSYTNLSSKNLLSVAAGPNNIVFGCYDFNQGTFLTESYDVPFIIGQSDTWTLGAAYTGYMDYYLYFGSFYDGNLLGSVASGVYNVPTGSGISTETVCFAAITGFINLPFSTTGITGYLTSGTNSAGFGQFGNVFPQTTTTVALTGITNSGIFQSGLTGLVCVDYTGVVTPIFQINEGYASGFGMETVLELRQVETGDIMKLAVDSLFNPAFNFSTSSLFSGLLLPDSYPTGNLNLFINGLYSEGTGYTVTGQFLFITGSTPSDIVLFDLYSGFRAETTGNTIIYSGQEIYLNGLNLVSGFDFTTSGGYIVLTGDSANVTGLLFSVPLALSYVTGAFQFLSGTPFARRTSNLYFNGLRQQINVDYIEGCLYDQLIGNDFDENNNTNIYDNEGTFWE